MKKSTIAVIGAGSTYTPELISGFCRRQQTLPVERFSFYDTDPERGEILAGMTRRMLKKAGIRASVILCTDLRQAVQGADFVVTQIRVGKMPARVLDERIPQRYGLLGQETTGLGGLSCALRTVPVIGQIAQIVRQESPEAWIVNFSNPSGLVAEAVLGQDPEARLIGLCNLPVKLEQSVRQLMQDPAADCEFVGLNHLCWLTEVYQNGTGQLEKLLGMPLERSGLNNIPDMKYTPQQLLAIGGFPCGYLNYYYFRQEMVEKASSEAQTRGEVCMELERQLLALYADPCVDTPPELLARRGGAMYSEAAVSLMDSIANDSGQIHVVNVQNRGVMPMLRPGDVAELRCRVGRDGPQPLPLRKPPGEAITGLIQAVKAYERLAARAAFTGCYTDALAAALSHPLSGDFGVTKAALDALLCAHRQWLPRFETYFTEKEGRK